MGFWSKFLSLGLEESYTEKGSDIPTAYIQQEGRGPEYSLTDEPSHFFWTKMAAAEAYSAEELIGLFHNVPEIFAPIHEIASRVSDAVWELRRWKDDQVIHDDKDFNRLFATPNPLLSFKKFIYEAVCYELVTGRNYFYFNIPDSLARDWRNIAAWWNLPAHKVKVDINNSLKLFSAVELKDIIKSYYIQEKDGSRTYFDTDKVLAINQVSLDWKGRYTEGKSPLNSAEKAIRNLVAVYSARYNVYDKRGMLGVFVSRKTDAGGSVALTKTEKVAATKDLNSTYGVTRGRSPFAVTDQPIDFLKVSMSIAEMQPFDETLADAVAIYKTLRVPRHLVPSKDNSTFANAESDMRSFYQDVIIPMAGQYAEAFTNYFRLNDGIADSRLKRYIVADFSHIDVLQENKKEKADTDKVVGEVYEKRFLSGICTLNEWVIAAGGEKVNLPLYDKRIFEMTPEELQQIKLGLNLKAPAKPAEGTQQNEEDNENNNNSSSDPVLQVA